MRINHKYSILFSVVLLLVFISISSLAMQYPEEKAIRIISPTGAGGSNDIVSRLVTSSAQQIVGQRMDAVAMPGAGGQEAINFVMNEPHDGYTFLISDYGNLVAAALREEFGYDFSEWKPIVQITEYIPTIFVKEDSPIKDANDWITKAKAEPNKFSIAHGTNLCPPHVGLILVEKAADIQNSWVPTSGGSEALAFILGGHVDIASSIPTTIASSVDAGLVRALGLTSAVRSKFLPDTPTFKELGYDVVSTSWLMIFAYKDVPEDRIEFMENKLLEALNTKGAQAMAKKLNIELSLQGREESQKIYSRTIEDLTSLFADLGMLKK